MKTAPILVITNTLALALAIYVYVRQGEAPSGPRRSEPARADSKEIAQLKSDIDDLRAQLASGPAPAATSDATSHGAPAAAPGAAAEGGASEPLASQPAEVGADPAAGTAEEFPPQEMEVFRRKVRKANELNDEEEQKKRILERADQLVKENKIAPLNPRQREQLATTTLDYRKKSLLVWPKLRDSGQLENISREDRGRVMRAEFENLRTEAQRSLEEFMPAADAKTYLDESMRETMRGGFQGFQGLGGLPREAPLPPTPAR